MRRSFVLVLGFWVLTAYPTAAQPGAGLGGECVTDTDTDLVCNDWDNCPAVANPAQADFDADGIGNACDTCTDWDSDGAGDSGFANTACPVANGGDNCGALPNPSQGDTDSDGKGDACDPCPADPTDADTDADGICDGFDTCPGFPNTDTDADGICNSRDNCPLVANGGQADRDGDAIGDACDTCTDWDGDGIGDPGFQVAGCVSAGTDNCVAQPNTAQADLDGDGLGNLCDPCAADALNDGDGDGFCSNLDNCATASNPGQEDADGDGIGDACDPTNDSPPRLLNYQGRLADANGLPLTGPVTMEIEIVDGAGTPLGWSESHAVAVQDGFFSLLLGGSTPFPANLFSGPPTDANGPVRFLRVRVNGELLAPDRRIVSVPYELTVAP